MRIQKCAVLASLREMYVDVWQIPEQVPEDRRDAVMERLIERDVLGTRDGLEADSSLNCLVKQKTTLENMTLADRMKMMKDHRNIPFERVVVVMMLMVDAHTTARLKAEKEARSSMQGG